MTNPGLTRDGKGIMHESINWGPAQATPQNMFRAVTIWARKSESSQIYYQRAFVLVGDVWKLIAATLENDGRQGFAETLWITVGKLEYTDSPWWAKPSFLGSTDGAKLWEWERNPTIVWQRPDYNVPTHQQLLQGLLDVNPYQLLELRSLGSL